MKIKCTKTFAKFINETALTFKKSFHASLVKISANSYESVTGGFPWIGSPDYDCETNSFNTIKITYPADFYACPRYFSTDEIVSNFKAHGIRNVDELENMLIELFEI